MHISRSFLYRSLGLVAITALFVASSLSLTSCRHTTEVQIDTMFVHDTVGGGMGWNYALRNNTGAFAELEFVNASVGYAVGMYGQVVRTSNGGSSWTPVASTSSGWLYDVHFFDELNGIVVGDDATPYHTTDGGQSWTAFSIGSSELLRAMYFATPQEGFILTSSNYSGTIYRTSDGGATWASVSSNTTGGLYSVRFRDAQQGVALGKYGTAFYTQDGGLTWSRATTDLNTTSSQLTHARYVDANTIYAVGGDSPNAGYIVRSTDAGKSWTTIQTHNFFVQALAYDGDKTLTAAGYNGNILQSKDLGATWVATTFGTQRWIAGAYMNPKHLVLVGGEISGTGQIATQACD